MPYNIPGSKDDPGITRMTGYYIDGYNDAQFDTATMQVSKNGERTDRQIEGRVISIHYVIKNNVPATSMVQVVRNHQNAARAAGGQVLDDPEPDEGGPGDLDPRRGPGAGLEATSPITWGPVSVPVIG